MIGPLSVLDLLLVGGLCLAAYLGYRSGAPKKLFTLCGILLGLLLAARFMHPLAAVLASSSIVSGSTALVLAFLLLLGLTCALLWFLFRKLGSTKVFKRSGELVGLVLGAAEGMLLLSLLLWVLLLLDEPSAMMREHSRLYRPVKATAPALFGLVRSVVPGARELESWLEPPAGK